ncbi:Rab geranylgeranyltransferase [Dissophora globulifera]|uniref:Geranylgeranyl transferase type-2 subunit alpha n=1 Tax=Dissophora globulifera TaxID=979702 RepID=A0A9P6RBY2_9FUNG|nr:Rab geranylgeranyltransferase [Dissophora globulifera]
MECQHGQKKEKARSSETPETLRASQEYEALLVREYRGLKDKLMDIVYSKKRDNEALGIQRLSYAFRLTTSLLNRSPDYYTIWNVRRTILQEGFLEGADAEKADQIYSHELMFVQENLKLNPKSYFMWNHRLHGWDYRRYIIRQMDLQVPKVSSEKILERVQSEFDYTTTKISQNFSDYSAWHNRSTLLGKLAVNMTEEERQTTVDSEFDLVKNAIYTDPEDQSAWLYHLWLIGRESRNISILGSTAISFHPLEIVVAFDEIVKFLNPPTVSTMVNHLPVPLAGEWKATGTDSTIGTIWIFQQAPGAEYGPTVELVVFEDDVCSFRLGARLHSAVCFELETVEKDLSKISGRLGRLVVVKNLMCDVTKRIGHGPDPDGTLDTQEENRRKHSTQAKLLDDECIKLQEKLITIDTLRQERYEDRRTQLVFERETLHLIKDGKRFPEVEFEEDLPRSLDLSMRGLTHIPTSAYLMHLHTLNLDSNAITSTRFIRNLLNVRHVNLANNMIKRLEGLQHAPSLEILTLENNLIAKWEDVVAGFVFWSEGKLARTGGYAKVLLGNNPVVENEGGEYVLEKRWEDVGEIGLEIQWKPEELRLAEEALVAAEGVAGTSESHIEAVRRVSTTVVEFDAGH